MPAQNSGSAVAGFLDARRHTRDEVFGEPCPVPDKPGVHGWWFRAVPDSIDVSGCEQRDGLTLLYVGIAPTPPPPSGKPPVSQDLRKRIRYHYGSGDASAEGSTLRKSLGVLLATQLDIELRRIGSGERHTFAAGEAVLSQWMTENALVSWVVRPQPWLFEDDLIAGLDLPLNIQGNKRNTFYPELKRLRRDAVLKANKMRVLAEW
jgi:GIY-YIG catalytic domain